MKRYGHFLWVKPECIEEYKAYHVRVWPEVLATIRACHISNYSIYHKDGLLFAYYEYSGNDYHGDMARMAADPKTRDWWSIMMPMQEPLAARDQGQWWAEMEEVFHTD